MELPWQYSFPPFFTLQINEDTKRKQLDAWCDLVLNYCKHNRIFQLDASDYQNFELFSNKKIDRKCSPELVNVIFDELVRRGKSEWVNLKQSKKCFILWYTLDEWARIIYDYVNRRGLQNSVCTFYELIESKDNKNEKYENLIKLIETK